MHPSCALIIWLAAVLGIQFVGYAGLGLLLAAALVLTPGLSVRWRGYIWRARWLLLTLWLILAYNTPGEALHDLVWAPTYEGMAEGNLQAVRLVTMLACLSWLFLHLGHAGMICGLWGLLRPLRRLGLDIERVVVRLSLVLDNLQTPPAKGAWRQMLAAQPMDLGGQTVLPITLAPWRLRDSLLVAASALSLMGVAWW
ncbi:CbiQ family ECF transporter T component [Dechloromonas sp. HYN0024]|uniref:CbiQ family ECF transporter T component n=1 Tax=Dechloromonas sp. HYN0024 TaxID=2231055 RepID=UPI0013C37641|nr:CbiQ family ECF transporter T component [Dechloromonas sp. HYN0024]